MVCGGPELGERGGMGNAGRVAPGGSCGAEKAIAGPGRCGLGPRGAPLCHQVRPCSACSLTGRCWGRAPRLVIFLGARRDAKTVRELLRPGPFLRPAEGPRGPSPLRICEGRHGFRAAALCWPKCFSQRLQGPKCTGFLPGARKELGKKRSRNGAECVRPERRAPVQAAGVRIWGNWRFGRLWFFETRWSVGPVLGPSNTQIRRAGKQMQEGCVLRLGWRTPASNLPAARLALELD